MAAFYRANRVEELDWDHPGLKDFVDDAMRRRVSQGRISREVQERFGVHIPERTLSRYWTERFAPEEAREIRALRDIRARVALIRQEARKHPRGSAAKIIQTLVVDAIVQQKQRVAETDVMRLMEEQRKRQELEEKVSVEWGKLQVQFEKVENDKRRLEEKHSQVGAVLREAGEAGARALLSPSGAGGQAKSFDPAEALKKISEVIGVGAALEERVETQE